MHACTIVARNYLAFARVLAESFLAIHPGSSFTTLVVDAEFGLEDRDEPFQVLTPAELDLSQDEFHRMAVMYDVTELSTALKPWTLRYLIEHGAEAALYIDPDIQLFSPIDDVAEMVASHGVALTPHTLAPMPRDNRRPSEADIMGSGVYNLGFIGVGPSAVPFLRWWEERLMRDAISAPEQMLFTDQRWVDFVPSYFQHFIIRDPGFNVAYWNLDTRKVTKEGDRFLVNGVPLRFFHFSGYRPETPWILSRYVASSPRVLLSEQPVLLELCEGYSNSLGMAAFNHTAATPYGFNALADGTPVTGRMRRIYREAVLAHEQGNAEAPPMAFGPSSDGGAEFLAWLNEPVDGPTHAPLTRFMLHIWNSRDDLQWAYRDPAGAGWEGFFEWMQDQATSQEGVPAALIPARPPSLGPGKAPKPAPGVNIVGYFRAELGVGQTARYMLDAAKEAGLDYSIHTNAKTLSRQQHPLDEDESSLFPHDVNILVINADQTGEFLRDAPFDIRKDRYTIGVWAWEVDELPPWFNHAFTLVDEVWAVSRFVQRSLVKHSPVPVHVFPKPIVEPEIDPTITRASLGLPSGFVFLFSFDYLSVLKRKNPVGLIEAFKRAFAPGEGPTLVIKSINGDKRLTDREQVRFAVDGRPDIVLLEDYLSVDETRALTALCDCYVSLHRSEGYGLTMSEALSLGRPVIATGYSGNLDFMDERTAYLVPYELVPVGKNAEPYSPTAVWAEPDLDTAAAYMRRVYEHPDEAVKRARLAQQVVLERQTLDATANYVKRRVDFAHEVLAGERALPLLDEAPPVVDEPHGPDLYQVFQDRVETAFRQLDSVPDPHGPTRLPFIVPFIRRLQNRLLAHHDAHQRASLARLLESTRALSDHNQAWHAHLEQLIADQRARNESVREYIDHHVTAMHDEVRTLRMRNQAYDIRLADLTARLDDVVGDHQAASRQRLAADIARARADVEAAEQRTAALTHAALSSLDPSGGGRQQAQAEFLTAALRPGDTFVDIGAHVGWHAAVAARAVGPSGHVIAVEPSPDVLAVLRRNLEDGLPDTAVVSVQPVAAWDEDAALTFVVSTDDPAGGRTFPAALDRDGDKVEGRRLDTLEALSDHTVAAVRTDVGGAEHRTLRGLRKTIERDRPVVLTEFAPERILELGDDPAAVLAEWADMGYAISLLPGDASATVDAAEIVRAAGSGSVSLCLTPLDPGHDPLAS